MLHKVAKIDVPEPIQPAGAQPLTDGRDGYLVLGMHRSGTSAVAGMLAKLGAAPPATLMPPADDNVKGFWESKALAAFHDELLESAGSHWNDWRELNPEWRTTPVAASFRARAVEILKEEFGDNPSFVLKDPRICRFAWFWLDIFAEQDIRPRIVIPVRSPLEVAKSLSARDGHTVTRSLLVWLGHILDAESNTRHLPRVVVNWPTLLADWRLEANRIAEALGVTWPRSSDQAAVEIDDFLSADLRHQHTTDEELKSHPAVHVWIAAAYDAMLALAIDPGSNSAQATLDDVRSQFDMASGLFGQPLAAIEHSELEVREALRDLGVRHNALGQAKAAGEAAAAERHAETDQALRTAQGEIDRLRAVADAGVVERDGLLRLISERDLERDALLAAKATVEAEAVSMKASMDLVSSERDALKRMVADHERDQAMLASLTAANDRKLADLQDRLGETIRERDTAIHQRNLLSQDMALHDADRVAAETEAADLRALLADTMQQAEREAANLRASLADTTQQAETEAANLRASLADATNQAATLQAKIDALKQRPVRTVLQVLARRLRQRSG